MTKPPQLSFLSGSSEGGRSVSVRDFQRMVDRRILDAPTSEAPYIVGSETSKAAAKGMSRELGAKQTQVWQFIRLHPEGCTDNQIITHFVNCGWSINTPRARRCELTSKGLVKDSGRQHKGSVLWVAANAAERQAAA